MEHYRTEGLKIHQVYRCQHEELTGMHVTEKTNIAESQKSLISLATECYIFIKKYCSQYMENMMKRHEFSNLVYETKLIF